MAPVLRTLKDKFIHGYLVNRHTLRCDYCRERAYVIQVTEVDLPHGVDPTDPRIIFTHVDPENKDGHACYLGITCGCYSRGHRQLAHIMSQIKAKEQQQPKEKGGFKPDGTWEPSSTKK